MLLALSHCTHFHSPTFSGSDYGLIVLLPKEKLPGRPLRGLSNPRLSKISRNDFKQKQSLRDRGGCESWTTHKIKLAVSRKLLAASNRSLPLELSLLAH